ncbi:MAG: manganese ABC transporter permease MntC [Flammeovirgaceae bacterium]
MNDLINIFVSNNPNLRWVLLAVILICTNSALVGGFAFLRKRSLAGDAVSHAILPGICLAFMFTASKNPFYLLIGAFVSGWIALLFIDFVVQHTKLKPDTALSLSLSIFYGFGILLLTSIQHSGNASQAGLDKFLFGKAAAMVAEDVYVFGSFSIILIFITILLFKPLKILCFDEQYAEVLGLPVKKLHLLLSILMVFSIAIGIQAVGVVLMAALLITPSASSRYWTNNLTFLLILSVVFSVFAGILGTFVSYQIPKMPTGPWIVFILSTITIISLLIGKEKGILRQSILQKRNQSKILTENILKALYRLGEKDSQFLQKRSLSNILEVRKFDFDELKKGIKKLNKQNLVNFVGDSVWLTKEGLEEGKRITRIHRLWEVYLTKVIKLPSDHVHDDAEAIEHIITPEIEAELLKKLDNPSSDPHNEPIPYSK